MQMRLKRKKRSKMTKDEADGTKTFFSQSNVNYNMQMRIMQKKVTMESG